MSPTPGQIAIGLALVALGIVLMIIGQGIS